MQAVTLNISGKSLEDGRNFVFLLLPSSVTSTGYHRTYLFRIKAGFLRDNSTSVGLHCLAKQEGRLASLCLYILQNLGL